MRAQCQEKRKTNISDAAMVFTGILIDTCSRELEPQDWRQPHQPEICEFFFFKLPYTLWRNTIIEHSLWFKVLPHTGNTPMQGSRMECYLSLWDTKYINHWFCFCIFPPTFFIIKWKHALIHKRDIWKEMKRTK